MKSRRATVAITAVLSLILGVLSDPAVAQEQKGPAQARIPGHIIAEVVRIGEPESKEPVAGVTGIIEISPETGDWRLIVERRGQARLSPDGRSLAFLSQEKKGQDPAVWIASVGTGDLRVRIADLNGLPVWSPDGEQMIISAYEVPGRPKFETWRMDADSTNRTKIAIPGTDQVLDWSAGGRLLVRRTIEGKSYVTMLGVDGAEVRRIRIDGLYPRLSPDGQKVVYTSKAPRGGQELTVSEVDGGNQRQINLGDNVTVRACWSPDGLWLAVGLMDLQKNENGHPVLTSEPLLMNCRLEIVDREGKERRPLKLPAGYVGLSDWR